MGRRYHGFGSAATGTDKTIIQVFPSATTVRSMIYDVIVGSVATPADQAAKFYLGRHTALGTEGAGFTPVALDPGDPSAISDFGVGVFSVEPTYTAGAQVLVFSMNQRATFRWVAAPGSELKSPVSANNGIGCKTSSGTGTAAFEVTFFIEE